MILEVIFFATKETTRDMAQSYYGLSQETQYDYSHYRRTTNINYINTFKPLMTKMESRV